MLKGVEASLEFIDFVDLCLTYDQKERPTAT